MLTGRVVFGLGGESLKVAQYTIVYHWFEGQEMNYAMGLTLGISQFGTVVNGWVTPQVFHDSDSIGTALLVGFLICCVSLLAAFMIVCLDRKANQYSLEETMGEEKFEWKDFLHLGLSFWLLAISSIYIYMTVSPYMQTVVR
jgi:MFS family permease